MEAVRERAQEAIELFRSVVQELTAPGLLPNSSDSELLDGVSWVEEFGRLADAARIAMAAEVDDRCRSVAGPSTLADRFGCATPSELLERVARISADTARSRLRLGRQTHPTTTLTGEPVPAEFDVVRRGLVCGRLGIDSAVLITRMLSRVKVGVPTDTLAIIRQAERELVCAAIGAAPDPETPALPPVPPFETVIHIQAWEAVLTRMGRNRWTGSRPAGSPCAVRRTGWFRSPGCSPRKLPGRCRQPWTRSATPTNR